MAHNKECGHALLRRVVILLEVEMFKFDIVIDSFYFSNTFSLLD